MTPGMAPTDGDSFPKIFDNMFKLLTDVERDCLELPYNSLSSTAPEPVLAPHQAAFFLPGTNPAVQQ